MNLVFGGDVSETNDFAIIGIPDITIDKVIEEQIVDDGEVGVTFEVGLEWEFGSLDIEGIVIDSFQGLLIIEYSIFSHFVILFCINFHLFYRLIYIFTFFILSDYNQPFNKL